jgi:oxygen-independent coproporphyrinogen-3 oxidase
MTSLRADLLAKYGTAPVPRYTMGVQDFDPEVQQRVNRPQSFEETRDLVEEARRLGFVSVNIDLMYGLPLQTVAKFDRTLDLVEQLSPDRIALFGFAHMPKLKKHHKLIIVDELPGPQTRLALLERAIERLLAMGYVYVGLDHFAKADDELCRARGDGTLRRNFMGYTTCAESDVLAFGPSSISEVGGAFLQSEREVRDWAARVEAGHLPTVRGFAPSRDDDVRRDVIQRLFCRLELDTEALSKQHHIDFEAAFARELEALSSLEKDGLVERAAHKVKVTPVGQLLLRNVAAVFDAYLPGNTSARSHAPAV